MSVLDSNPPMSFYFSRIKSKILTRPYTMIGHELAPEDLSDVIYFPVTSVFISSYMCLLALPHTGQEHSCLQAIVDCHLLLEHSGGGPHGSTHCLFQVFAQISPPLLEHISYPAFVLSIIDREYSS